ncbi:MAG: hypothetical protein EBR86_08300 [Planctomycetia bacterium]|nr:hypothetical protein [Planctomycetia bacterium]
MNLPEWFVQRVAAARTALLPAKRRMLPVDAHGAGAAALIAARLAAPGPCMISRFGSTELAALLSVWDIRDRRSVWVKRWKVLLGEMRATDRWSPRIRRHMADWSGFFPLTDAALERFADRLAIDAREIDLLGSWLPEETRVRHLFPHARLIPGRDLRPELYDPPWSRVLAGRRVLVVHPFAESIRRQFARRERLFPGRDILPPFELTTLAAVQSLGGESHGFADWFAALDWMCRKIDETAHDIVLIGAGAYGLPLAAHVKRSGGRAIHLGGPVQIMFGILGGRWDTDPVVQSLKNDAWTRPLPEERPPTADRVEQACYW